ncbi:T9SS type A sorting domain-containing protein, partial [Flavobacteriales bacterium]|nr:T9SS type A sorting domain-containing protein [Flavobacteriales bacterium]
WDSITYTESGIYTNSYTNSYGCDSTHTLVLTVDETTYGVDEIIACDEFTWIDGLTYTESTDSAMFTLTNAEGCDSIITLNLTILESTSSLSVVTECYSYSWNDSTYTQSGTYIFETTGQNGCDSIATLELTINNSTSGVDVQESCDDFTWIDGITYTESTDSATFVLINSVGCDSTVTLDLTINYSDSTFESFTACDSYLWNGINCIASGMYYYTTSNSLGCDSIVTLDLTIINSSSSVADVIACDSYFWNNELYTESGTYTVNTYNVGGCDSTATLNLTINGPSTSTDYVSTCEAYQWNGEVYFESGTYTYNSIDIYGCDSIATLELEICTLEELIIDGFNSVDTESSVTYSVQENLGSSYFWTISNLGFISSGQFTNEITVDWSILEGNSTICVTESRDCFGLDCEGDTYCTNIEVKDVVGIEDISSDFVEIYPNPTRGIFNVSIQLNKLQNVNLELVNSLGELVSDKNLGESKGELNESFDLTNQPSGIYLLRILLDDKVITRKVTLN